MNVVGSQGKEPRHNNFDFKEEAKYIYKKVMDVLAEDQTSKTQLELSERELRFELL